MDAGRSSSHQGDDLLAAVALPTPGGRTSTTEPSSGSYVLPFRAKGVLVFDLAHFSSLPPPGAGGAAGGAGAGAVAAEAAADGRDGDEASVAGLADCPCPG